MLGAGSFAVYGSDESRLARLCTERSSVPQMKVVEPPPPTFSWRFANQSKLAPDVPVLASLETYIAQNRQLWAELMQAQDEMTQWAGGSVLSERYMAHLNIRAQINESEGRIISLLAKRDAALGTTSRLHVSQDSFVFRSQAPMDIDASFRLADLVPSEHLMFPTVEVSAQVTCYSAITADGKLLAAVFPTSWTLRPLVCSNNTCKDWGEFIATIPPKNSKAD